MTVHLYFTFLRRNLTVFVVDIYDRKSSKVHITVQHSAINDSSPVLTPNRKKDATTNFSCNVFKMARPSDQFYGKRRPNNSVSKTS